MRGGFRGPWVQGIRPCRGRPGAQSSRRKEEDDEWILKQRERERERERESE